MVNFGSIKLIKPTWYCSYYSKLKKKEKEKEKKRKTKWLNKMALQMYNAKTLDCIVQKHCTRIRAFIYKKKEYKSMIEKKKKSTY